MIRGYSIHIGLEHVLYDNLSEGEVNNYTSESTRVSSFDRTKNTRDPLGKSLEHLEQRCVRYCTGIFRYRYWCRTELTEVSGTGNDVVPKWSKSLKHPTHRDIKKNIIHHYNNKKKKSCPPPPPAHPSWRRLQTSCCLINNGLIIVSVPGDSDKDMYDCEWGALCWAIKKVLFYTRFWAV